MKFLLVLLISILSLFVEASDLRAYCVIEPAVTIDYYFIDYSGGAETSDDESFKGRIICGEKTLAGKFSYGNNTGQLYWLEPMTPRWILVY